MSARLFPWLLTVVLGCVFAMGPAREAAAEEVTVAVNPDFPPFESVDKDGRIIGFDIDLMEAIGREAGFTVKWMRQSFDTLVESLAAGKVGAVASGMTITDERRQRIDFSDPYYKASQAIVIRKGTPALTRPEELKGKRVCVQMGTTGAFLAEEVLGQGSRLLKQFRHYSAIFNELKIGRADCVVVDAPVARAYLALEQFNDLEISADGLSSEEFGFGIAKGNGALLARVNAGLKAVRASGEYRLIYDKWFAAPPAEEDDGAGE